jgi:hypothetical protein
MCQHLYPGNNRIAFRRIANIGWAGGLRWPHARASLAGPIHRRTLTGHLTTGELDHVHIADLKRPDSAPSNASQP